MFDSLTGKLQNVFRNLRGLGRISESNVSDSLRDVRMALLDADVNFKVARDFIENVKQKALGEKVLQTVQPGQQIIKLIHDELVVLLGSENAGLNLQGSPASIMMVGLHGSGKTTSSGKLARLLQKQGRNPLLVAADVYRPAAMEQLATLGKTLELPVFVMQGETDVLRIGREALEYARANQRDTLIFDTAGRLQIDEPLVQELVRLRELVQPSEILLVLDAATGQEAVNVATHFDQALKITGAILTKLDGDARGGAALSLKAVTGKPIKFAGVGEKLEDFEPFHPERMASRILGMGDVVSLVEKAQEHIDQKEAEKMAEALRKGDFNLDDFLAQMQQIKKMGSMQSIVGMMPGMSGMQLPEGADKQMARTEAIIKSMTKQERRKPDILNGSRRKRIADGSGVKIVEVNQLLKQFQQMQKMMKMMKGGGAKKMMRQMEMMRGKGGFPGM